MITLIGTGHVFDLSAALLNIFNEKQPDIIGVELDQQRYQALILRSTDPATYQEAKKNLPIIYKMLARFQDSMAEQYGVNAGDEMLTAITYAQSHQLPVAFIDTDAQNLFIRMWKNMPFTEKLKLLFSGFAGLFVNKKNVEKELSRYQQNFDAYIEEIGKKFPTIKRTLIDDRNQHMVNNLITLNEKNQRIIVCIGDGHVPGISKLLQEKQIPYETIRLQELQNIKPNKTDGTTASFSINYTPL
ncbi:MAG: TraB/GumN family protein [Candidatus Thermoplasmatota archaeon]|nr:TraB/GumN family protein [Candidatus Thermoplasmatota archaeon]